MSKVDEADHREASVPHELPRATYARAFGALLALTATTVAVSYADVGSWNIVIALLVATAKATLVAAVFMHLWYDHRFNALVLGSTVFFLFVLLAFTMADTATRGRAEAIEAARPRAYSAPFNLGKPDLRGAAPGPNAGGATKSAGQTKPQAP